MKTLIATIGFLSILTSVSQASIYIGNDCATHSQKAVSIHALSVQKLLDAQRALQDILNLGPKPSDQFQARVWEMKMNDFQKKLNKASALQSKLTAMALLNDLGDYGICHVEDGRE